MTTTPPKQYKWLTHAQKRASCDHAAATGTVKLLTTTALADWAPTKFNVPPPSQATISRVLARSADYRGATSPDDPRKKATPTPVAAFDSRARRVFDDMDGKMDITGAMVKEIARTVAADDTGTEVTHATFSNGWLQKSQRRQGISRKRKHGEAGSVDQVAVQAGREKVRRLTDPYARSDVYNMGETSYYYQYEANVTVSAKAKVAGWKQNKNRLTLALAVNAGGSDKLPPVFIGTVARSVALRDHLESNGMPSIDAVYFNSRKEWMNSAIFQQWLYDLDSDTRATGRRILLLVDNVSSHIRPTAPPLANVRLEHLPKNQTSVVKPLDQGIIVNVKSKVKSMKAMHSVTHYFEHGPTQPKVDVYSALQ